MFSTVNQKIGCDDYIGNKKIGCCSGKDHLIYKSFYLLTLIIVDSKSWKRKQGVWVIQMLQDEVNSYPVA